MISPSPKNTDVRASASTTTTSSSNHGPPERPGPDLVDVGRDPGDEQVREHAEQRRPLGASTRTVSSTSRRRSRVGQRGDRGGRAEPEQRQPDHEVRVVVEELERDDPRVGDLECEPDEARPSPLSPDASARPHDNERRTLEGPHRDRLDLRTRVRNRSHQAPALLTDSEISDASVDRGWPAGGAEGVPPPCMSQPTPTCELPELDSSPSHPVRDSTCRNLDSLIRLMTSI